MKKTLTVKKIKGIDYYYLCFRNKGKLISEYLGNPSSIRYKKFLYSLASSSKAFGLVRAKRANFAAGVPVCYSEEGFVVLEYKNGAKEFIDSKGNVAKVVFDNGR